MPAWFIDPWLVLPAIVLAEVAWIVAMLVRNLTSVPMALPWSSVIIGVGLSATVGLFFGIYPRPLVNLTTRAAAHLAPAPPAQALALK